MEALHIPDYSDANPYQRELQQALATEDVSASVATGGGFFPVIDAARAAEWPDIVHLHWLHPYLIGRGRVTTLAKGSRLLLELLILRLAGIQIVWTVHNDIEHERRAPYLERGFKHLIFRLCGIAFIHCGAMKEEILRTFRLPGRYRSRIVVIDHGNYVETYASDTERAPVELGPERDETTFLFFGQIRPYKGVTALVDAFRSLESPDAELLIVGNPSSAALRERIERRSRGCDAIHTVFEYVPDSAVLTYLDLADVVVLPYENVLTSGTVVLAMGEGKPVVTPAIGCLEELLTDAGEESAELTYDPETEGALADALRRSLEADLATVGRQNRALVRGHEWEDVAAATARAYERIQTTPADDSRVQVRS